MQPLLLLRPSSWRARVGLLAALFVVALSLSSAVAQIPAFPGAEGFGAYATGGRGGDVYTVVNLNSSGAGSLNYGVQTAPAQGRTIVFAVSGYIPIANNSDTGNKTVRIVQNKVTIAGQTAPGDGIGLKDGRILMTGNNLVLRHLRIRHGKYGGAGDCINLDSSAINSIIDHISLMFSTDENISFFSSTLDNFTMQYCTSSWGMERHNAGGLWDLVDGSCHHTLWAHHRTRNPKARPYGLLEWINNVTYHWRTEGFIMGDSQSNVDWRANVRGCYFLSIADHQFGTDNTALSKARIGDNGTPNFALYLDNCLHDSNTNGLLDGTDKGYGIVAGTAYPAGGTTPGTQSYDKSLTPFTGATGLATVNIDAPLTAYKKVLSSAGALRLNATYAGSLRDELDTLLVSSVEKQESILVAKDTPLDASDTPSNGEALLAAPPYNISNGGFGTLNSATAPLDTDLDGMPDFWETALGWNAAVQDHNTAMPNSGGFVTGLTFFPPNTPAGYTRLEEYLHFKAIPHAVLDMSTVGMTNSLTIDLRRFTKGFNQAPAVFTFSNITNGIVGLQPDGYTAVFTPTIGFAGRARFDFMVADGDGSTWTQTLAVLVYSPPTGPLPPTNLTANAVSSSQIVLGWNDASGNETGFRIERATNGVNFSEIASTSANVTAFTNIVAPATSNHYRVRAFNLIGNSAYSNTNSATTPAGSPAAPAALTATPANSRVGLAWQTSPGAASYKLKRSTTSGSSHVAIANVVGSGFTDLFTANGTTYYYVVSAVNGSGESINSAQASAMPSDALVYPAEDAAYGSGSVFENSNVGFHGSGYVNAATNNGSFIQFDNVDSGGGGACTLRFRSALGGVNTNRLSRLIVNGMTNSLLFTTTGTFANWVDRSFVTTLNPGEANQVRLESTGNDLANIDELTVLGTSLAPPVVMPTVSNVAFGAGGLVMSGQGGMPYIAYHVLSSTNLTTPLVGWARLATNYFDGLGNFAWTNPPTPGTSQQFNRLQVP